MNTFANTLTSADHLACFALAFFEDFADEKTGEISEKSLNRLIYDRGTRAEMIPAIKRLRDGLSEIGTAREVSTTTYVAAGSFAMPITFKSTAYFADRPTLKKRLWG